MRISSRKSNNPNLKGGEKHGKTHEQSLICRVRWLGFRHQNSSFGAKLGQDAARMAQDSAKMSQDSAKMGQEGAKMPQDGAKIGQDGPRWRQDGPSCGQTAACENVLAHLGVPLGVLTTVQLQ